MNKLKKSLHFRKKIHIIQWKIWDIEFLAFKMKKLREDIRMQYDAIKENREKIVFNKELVENVGIDAAKKIIERGPEIGMQIDKSRKVILNDNEKEFIKNLDAQIIGIDTDLKQMEKQMEGIDNELEKIDNNKDGLYSLLKMLKDYRQNL